MAANPIQVVPIWTPALAPVAAPKLTYRGGPLLTAVEVYTFFWGSAWQQAAQATLMQQVNQFFDFVLTSALLDQMAEYSTPGRVIGHGSRHGTKVVTDVPVGTSVTDAGVQQMIQGELAGDTSILQPGSNSLYFAFLPPGTAISMGSSSSCVNFCGYHSDIKGGTFYAVMPYPGCTGCLGGLSDLDALTSTCSHELCEAITDPVPGQGWYDDANGEIGDICAWQTKRLGPYAVQLEWSNRAQRCI
ncbi:MAG TPA: hypothetical protein VGG90_07540 [Candidatus Dormibacteraeota bacterium]|jgi:hypothetical protein